MEDHLTHTQYCGIPENAILDAVATVRDSIAYAESRNIPLCVLSLDLKNAFDRVSHGYLFKILHGYGNGAPFINGIRHMYEGAISSISTDQSQSDVQSARNAHEYGPVHAGPPLITKDA